MEVQVVFQGKVSLRYPQFGKPLVDGLVFTPEGVEAALGHRLVQMERAGEVGAV